ncbi:MAG: L-seryl-tRNA(Sec) selenium transferase [Deltaproteobacteria bacterium]|nr:L-seryl-tRNA(Sec) selenium transferase [Deltaproteobacteria bacterium]
MDDKIQAILRNIPKIDEIIAALESEGLFRHNTRELVMTVIRQAVTDTRQRILDSRERQRGAIPVPSLEQVAEDVKDRLSRLHRYSLRRIVNATGIVLHTNLGRAPLCPEAVERIIEVSGGYSNLEYNLAEGKRGLRYDHISDLLCILTGAEDAIVVNNNAAAVLLVLNTLSFGREAVVSRGELIEIGGEFRIPDVMEKSGAILREVGTTNRTHFYDYEKALNEATGIILKVHTSNFRTVGFTEEVPLAELVPLGNVRGIPVINDLGSGCFVDLERFGFEREPTVQEVVKTGVDAVTFSGDKLLGGPQAGVIAGKKTVMEKIKKNPLNRALRIDKLTLAALEATLKHYLAGADAVGRIRSLGSLTEPLESVRRRAEALRDGIAESRLKGLIVTVRESRALAGGGSLPTQEIPSAVVAVESEILPVHQMEERLRSLDVPVIGRIDRDALLLDVRTVNDADLMLILRAFDEIAGLPGPQGSPALSSE